MAVKGKEGTRSPLEKFCWSQLDKEGIKFEYERSYELFPPFSFTGTVIEKMPSRKTLSVKSDRYLNIKFTPDFCGEDWILEVKGIRRPDFNLRWKIFKNLIKDEGYLLIMPTNQAQVLASINIIKKWMKGDREWSNERILQEFKTIELSVKKYTKPKTVPSKKRSSGSVRKRRLNSSTSRFGRGLSID